jgi:Reverse transcriptase (RNA-dependent DNA polymerase)/Endonuclease-reverse transcriptase
MAKSLRAGTWNVNGLAQNRQEVELLISSNQLDILLVSETHFTDRNYFRLKGYDTYHTTHPDGTAHGGTAVIIRNSIKHCELPEYRTEYIQATSVKVYDLSGPVVFSAVYCPPRHSIKQDAFQAYLLSLGNRFIAGGDWNAKHVDWGSRLTLPRGRELKKALDGIKCTTVSAGGPTYWPTDIGKIPDLLDFFVIKGISSLYVQAQDCLDSASDHTPVILTLSTTVISIQQRVTLTNKCTDWVAFKEWLETNTNTKLPLKTSDAVDEATEYLTATIQRAAWLSTPMDVSAKQRDINYPTEVKVKVREKRRLRRVWHNSRNPADKAALNKAATELRRLIRKIKNETFKQRLEQVTATSKDDYGLWKIAKGIRREPQRNQPIKKTDGTWAKTDAEKADVFAKYLAEVFEPHPVLDTDSEREVKQYLEAPLQLDLPIKPFTVSEIKDTIWSKLGLHKAPGYDLITAVVLRNLPRKTLVLVTLLFNAILRTQHYPSQWKVAEVVMIPKPGKPPTEASSYRPVSLLPILSKVFEKLLLKRLMPILHHNRIIPDHQFGFRSEHSTIEQAHRLVEVIEESLERKQYCSAVFLDIKQAFDRVWHEGLLYKLKTAVPHPYYLLIKSYLNDRIFQVKYKDELSDFKEIRTGVPQGSVLGPVLYTIYTADLPESANTTTATYADDTAILSANGEPDKTSQTLQQAMETIQKWLKRWKIDVNTDKSVHVVFTLRKGDCPPVTLENQVLPRSDTARYLGMHLDKKLTWREHIKKKREELDIRYRKMYWLIGRKSLLSVDNKVLLYKAMLKPVWTYGIQLWGSAKNNNVEILQRFQNKVLKAIVNAPLYTRIEEIHEYLKIPTVKEEIRRYSEKYQLKLQSHPNHLAVNLLDNSEHVRRLKRYRTLDLSDR